MRTEKYRIISFDIVLFYAIILFSNNSLKIIAMRTLFILFLFIYISDNCTAQKLKSNTHPANKLVHFLDSAKLEKAEGYSDEYYIYICDNLYRIHLGGNCNSRWEVWKNENPVFDSEILQLQENIQTALETGNLLKRDDQVGAYQIECL